MKLQQTQYKQKKNYFPQIKGTQLGVRVEVGVLSINRQLKHMKYPRNGLQ